MEDVKKDVIPFISNKREFLSYTFHFHGNIEVNEYQLSKFSNNSTPSKEEIVDELLKVYPSDQFNFDYLEQYWIFSKK